MTRNVTEIQRRLFQLGFLRPESEVDGIFGENSLAAYNHYLASKGKPPHTGQLHLADLNANLFPEEQPAPEPKPIRKPGLFDALAIILTLSKGKPMTWDTTQQLIRIALYAGGSYFLGQQVADGQLFQAAMAGLVPVGAFLWWLVFERNRPKA